MKQKFDIKGEVVFASIKISGNQLQIDKQLLHVAQCLHKNVPKLS